MIVYWYPNCSTCKKAVNFLKTKNVSYELKNIKENPPSTVCIQKWIKDNQIPVRKLFNTSGLVYKELNLKENLTNYSEEEQIELLSKHGMLIKRPILIVGNDILIGFKETKWKELLGEKYAR